ncbi:MAG: hypothetical protein ACM3VW_05530 [Bacteroidota bacterium]
MAITRRQFVTRLGALAATVGFSQADVSKLTEAFAGNTSALGGTFNKPRVIWIHGAECPGCSTSLLGILEDANGLPFKASGDSVTTTGAALGLAGVTNALGGAFPTLGGATRDALYGEEEFVNIADVVIDVIDLQYHETVMGMGADLAARWLQDFITNNGGLGAGGATAAPFVLVIEGAMQDAREGGAWGESNTETPWCSIGMSANSSIEHDMAETVAKLAALNNCALVVPIGQCACYGGYPGCKPQITSTEAGFNSKVSQTGAKGAYDFLNEYTDTDAAFQAKVNGAKDKVVAVPGCPTNPWWFVLTVVMAMVDLVDASHPLGVIGDNGLPNPAAVDYGRRLKKVYPIPVHSVYCPRFKYWASSTYALKPGDPGCLQKLGCKGIGTHSLCGAHGWNNQQPQNAGSLASLNGGRGGHCTAAGHPCMGCTEKGYPDAFVPFVKR